VADATVDLTYSKITLDNRRHMLMRTRSPLPLLCALAFGAAVMASEVVEVAVRQPAK